MPSEAWNNKQVVKDLCVVGHGRGATSFAAHWLRKQGIRVEHERLGPEGIVESGFSVPTWGCRSGVHVGLMRDKFVFLYKVCIVRDPYKVIATYEQVEHPRAIFNHTEHLQGLVTDLLPPDWAAKPVTAQLLELEENRALRVNTIARSVVRWTQSGLNWVGGEFFKAEYEWNAEMPGWLKERGLWKLDDLIPRHVDANSVNHRKGTRMTRDEIDELLRPDVAVELADYRARIGYE